MLTGPIDVTNKLLKKARMTLADIDLIEVNEAFAAVVLRYLQAFDLDPGKVNVNGGAIALGHPLGATGAMILGTAIDELERRDSADRSGDALHRRRHGHGDDRRASVSARADHAEDRHRQGGRSHPGRLSRAAGAASPGAREGALGNVAGSPSSAST